MSNLKKLYEEELKLLEKLVKSESESNIEYKNAIKRTISRLNDELKSIETP